MLALCRIHRKSFGAHMATEAGDCLNGSGVDGVNCNFFRAREAASCHMFQTIPKSPFCYLITLRFSISKKMRDK
jgi:hypothetical protein